MMTHNHSLRFAILLRAAVAAVIVVSAFPAIAANDSLSRVEPQRLSAPAVTSYGTEFVQFATAANTGGNATLIDHPLTNSNANAIIIVTPNFNPGNTATDVYDDHPIGVSFTGDNWIIFNQDLAAMPVNASFNVLIPNPGAGVFVQTASAGNTECLFSQCTRIDNPLSNNNPNAILLVTPNFNPGLSGGVLDNHPIGVYYNGTKWDIFNQDLAAMPNGASFNVMILSPGPGVFVQKATAGNIFGDHTILDSPLTNSNPNAIVFATPNFNPGGGGGTYENHNIGVYYSSGTQKIAVFNQDIASMPLNAAFNILVAPFNTAVFVHTATAGNISGNHTYIDNPLSNNNPNAILLVTPNWDPGGTGGVYEDHPIGVYYEALRNQWAIFNQDGLSAPMPLGAAFNVMIFTTDAAEFVHRATASNISANYTTIDYPLANNQPNAIVLTTPNWNPGGVGGVYDNSPIGVDYNNSPGWIIFNQGPSALAMPTNAAFNVFIPPAGPAAFVQIATPANISAAFCAASNCTAIDNPLTNNNPSAVLFVTPSYAPNSIYDKHNIGVYYNGSKWTIFNQDLAAMPVGAAFDVYVPGHRLMLPIVIR